MTATPVTIGLAGGIGPDSAKKYLIGQKCVASLNAGGLQPTSYNWTVNGGEPFDGWFPDASSSVM
ncbi:MAG: hypothetical protein V4671_12630, partial [Armatimonadota bacterium]